ncbi:MAG: divalent-cation tolerance protein CutA [Deltaproteobacteria bacterium]|nr:divalent-cation tolerance protein CutA [Deltaproteobacteria bacterium]
MSGKYMMVFSTASNEDEAAGIGRKVVEEGLAACCNIVPKIRSIYTWKGKIHDEQEVLCVFKTRAMFFDDLKKRIKSLHSYEVPEIIAVEIQEGLPEYLAWIDEVTKG